MIVHVLLAVKNTLATGVKFFLLNPRRQTWYRGTDDTVNGTLLGKLIYTLHVSVVLFTVVRCRWSQSLLREIEHGLITRTSAPRISHREF